jgi:hypothetical protein
MSVGEWVQTASGRAVAKSVLCEVTGSVLQAAVIDTVYVADVNSVKIDMWTLEFTVYQ